jgi:hypothetical protein
MSRIHPMNKNELLKADTPDLMIALYEWSQKGHAVMDHELVEMSPFLTFTHTDLTTEQPPSFYLIGKKSAARDVFGNQWADNIRKSQASPIKNHKQPSAEGYFKALQNDFNFDHVEFDTDDLKGIYRRLIVPVRTEIGMQPSFFVMLPMPIQIEHKHRMPDVEDRSSSNKQAQNFH